MLICENLALHEMRKDVVTACSNVYPACSLRRAKSLTESSDWMAILDIVCIRIDHSESLILLCVSPSRATLSFCESPSLRIGVMSERCSRYCASHYAGGFSNQA